jgi:ABC-2 type transport system permease protein
MNPNVVFAIFRRNFAGYFSSPIGYVFICAFVLLSGFAAFWPNEFFNANLATLDQLNQRLPWIMLVFIPAITMSIWAEERREATDELILTLPSTDLDVVTGKYLAALAIFTVALLFSITNIVVLRTLGQPDIGLLVSNYFGYWLVGAAMLAIGMVASFLTNSLTVAFILGMAFNAPLVFASSADSIVPWDGAARLIKSASIAEQFSDFAKGMITLSSIVFFASITMVCLYLSMVLLGRRHWAGGPGGSATALHFAVRTLCLIAVALGLSVLASRFDLRADVSAEKVNSLSSQTHSMLGSIDTPRPVYIEAYVSPEVPEEYVQTRLNLLSMLREVQASSGDKVVVRVHETPRFSEDEAQAEQQFGIRAMPVQSGAGGKMALDQIVLGAAFTCGLDKVVVPFFDRGIPVEYEIIRSIATVSQQCRRKIGVLTTDAKLFGGFEMESMTSRAEEKIIQELKKQYEVVQVDPEQPITERYDALLAVQPSSLSPTAMPNFIAAVQNGQPTAIFEDPFPFLDTSVPATSQPRTPPRRNPFQQQPPPQPKGDIKPLWNMLGLIFRDQDVVWQDYNPLPKLADLPREFVFIGQGSGVADPFNAENPITSGLQQLLTLFPGSIVPTAGSPTRFAPLAQTGKQTGTVAFGEILQRSFLGPSGLNPNRRHRQTRENYVLAAHISGPAPSDPVVLVDPPTTQPAGPASLNVVVVSDIDVLYSVFFAMRARGRDANDPVDINVDNVTFVLNTLDFLAGDDRFIDIRKRRPAYRTLTTVEAKTEKARDSANERRESFIQQFENKRDEEQKRLDDKLAELKQRQGVDPQQVMIEVATAQQAGQNRLKTAIERMEKERDQELATIERDVALQVRNVQDRYKLAAIALPPIPPLIVGAVMFFRRRSMEKIGVPKARLR